MQYKGSDHTLVICAYKESPFLEECIVSLKKTKHTVSYHSCHIDAEFADTITDRQI